MDDRRRGEMVEAEDEWCLGHEARVLLGAHATATVVMAAEMFRTDEEWPRDGVLGLGFPESFRGTYGERSFRFGVMVCAFRLASEINADPEDVMLSCVAEEMLLYSIVSHARDEVPVDGEAWIQLDAMLDLAFSDHDFKLTSHMSPDDLGATDEVLGGSNLSRGLWFESFVGLAYTDPLLVILDRKANERRGIEIGERWMGGYDRVH